VNTRPRKAPTQQRARETIDCILQATGRVLIEEGFDGASTNRIAAAAGVSVGSLYQYFPSKEALVAALIERHVEEMTRELAVELSRVVELPLAGAVRRLVELMLRAHAVDPALHRVLIEQVPRVGRLERLHEIERRVGILARAYLEAHARELRVKDLDQAAFIAVTVVEALTHAAVLHRPEHLSRPALAEEITELVVRYLAKSEPRARRRGARRR
jgi:AcrR family transcriptional regulator